MEADDEGVIVMDELSPNPMHAAPTVPDVDTHALKTDAERSAGEDDKYAEVPTASLTRCLYAEVPTASRTRC